MLATAAFVAVFGLVDVYAVPLSWWRHSARLVPATSSGSTMAGLSHLPENFVYNAGGGVVFRRLTSTFLSPLATAYLLVVALFFVPLRRAVGDRRSRVLLFAALLWTHTRAALIALVAGLLVLAVVRRRRAAARARRSRVVVVGLAFVKGYDHFAPRTHFTAAELRSRSENAKQHPSASHDPTSANESSTSEHLASLRDGAKDGAAPSVGLRSRQLRRDGGAHARAGQGGRVDLHRARRRDRARSAGSSSSPGRSRCCARRCVARAWLGAAFAAVLVLGLQTDVIGVPWIAVVVWALAGSVTRSTASRSRARGRSALRVVLDGEPGRLERGAHLVVR